MKKHIIKCYDDLDVYHISRKGNLISSNGVKVEFKICIYCGLIFSTRYNRQSLYCSDKCKDQYDIDHISQQMMQENYKFISYTIINKRKYIKSICPNGHEYLFLKHNWDGGHRCQKCTDKYKRLNNPSWKGGYYINNIPIYNTYSHQLIPYNIDCKRDDIDHSILNVKCMYCGKWFTPTITSIRNKIQCINGEIGGEHNLYCSDGCKYQCPTFNQILYPKGYKQATSREVQPQLRKLVFERDNYTCQKCDGKDNLHCHHITGIEINPIESADIDNCITLCEIYHKELHKQNGCKYHELQRC